MGGATVSGVGYKIILLRAERV